MSKLETAFSKALKENPSDQEKNAPLEEDKDNSTVALNLGSEKAISNRTGISGLASSRSQIKQMSQQDCLSDRELADRRIIYPRMKDRNLLNVYRNLRTKLLSVADGNPFTTLVTSVAPDTQSGLIATNIAASFAFDEGKTAMLIEGDVHSSSLTRLFNLEQDTAGLMDYLDSEESSVATVIHDTGIPRLRFIPNGYVKENSSEHFSSEKMQATVEEIVTRYPDRYPVVNAPSVQDSADARILMDLCDQVVLVVPFGRCTEQDISNAAGIIGTEKLAGVVLDQF